MAAITLTVFFEDPFWVGVVERQEGDTLHAARHIFGSEPSPPQVLEIVLYQLSSLLAKPAVAVSAEQPAPRPANPKRAARGRPSASTARQLCSGIRGA